MVTMLKAPNENFNTINEGVAREEGLCNGAYERTHSGARERLLDDGSVR